MLPNGYNFSCYSAQSVGKNVVLSWLGSVYSMVNGGNVLIVTGRDKKRGTWIEKQNNMVYQLYLYLLQNGRCI